MKKAALNLFFLILILVVWVIPAVVSAQPNQVNYQGILIRDGIPFTGDVEMKFAIIGEGASLWSLDGTSEMGSEPESSVSLFVTDGVFNVVLGGEVEGQPGLMVPLTPEVLDGFRTVELRVWVSDDSGVFELMSDQPFSSTPFALVSDIAHRSLGDFSVGGDILGGRDLRIPGQAVAGSFVGDGSGLTGVQTTGLAPGTYVEAYSFTNVANSFVGNGAGLTNVQAQDLAGGTHANPYNFSNQGNSFSGDGSGLTGVQSTDLAGGLYPNAYSFTNPANTYVGSGAGLQGVTAADLGPGSFSGQYDFENPNNTFSGDGSRLTGVEAASLAPGDYNGTYSFSNPANSYSGEGSGLAGVTAQTLAPGSHGDVYFFSNPANAYVGDGSGLTNVPTGDLAPGSYDNAYDFTNPANTYAGDGSGLTGLSNWAMDGNEFTEPDAGDYLGTADNVAFHIGVDGRRAGRIEPTPGAPNIIWGMEDNVVNGGVEGVVIAGGGAPGEPNVVESQYGTIGGGSDNMVTPNFGPGFSADYGTVGGGYGNRALGRGATVPGGMFNYAEGNYSFAAGRRADARRDGSLVLADGLDKTFPAETDNEFAVRATGGVRMVTAVDPVGIPVAGVSLTPGAGSWSSLSDVNSKDNIEALDGEQVMNRLRDVSVSTWNYKTQDPATRHAGPMAQDFRSSFGLGDDERRISSMDMAGINMAAIKALDARTRDLRDAKAELEELRQELGRVKVTNEELLVRLDRLEKLMADRGN